MGLNCHHDLQRMDPEGRFWCIDCGADCGTGKMVALDAPIDADEVREALGKHRERRDREQN